MGTGAQGAAQGPMLGILTLRPKFRVKVCGHKSFAHRHLWREAKYGHAGPPILYSIDYYLDSLIQSFGPSGHEPAPRAPRAPKLIPYNEHFNFPRLFLPLWPHLRCCS